MQSSKIIDELTNKPRSEVEADLARIHTERARLEHEERFLLEVLDLIDATQKPEEQERGPSKPAQPMPGTNRDHILAIMRLRGFEPWTITRVVEAVQDRNPQAQAPAIRAALRRLNADGVLMRDQNGNYRLDPQHNGRLQIITGERGL
jgi:hypothetical protein